MLTSHTSDKRVLVYRIANDMGFILNFFGISKFGIAERLRQEHSKMVYEDTNAQSRAKPDSEQMWI